MAKYSRTKRVTRSKKHNRRHRTRKNMRGGLGEDENMGAQASGALSSVQDTFTGLGTQASNMVSQPNETAQGVNASGEKKTMFSFLGFGGRRRRRKKSSHRKK
jgi:hypothetical protein